MRPKTLKMSKPGLLERGRLVEDGTHDALIKTGGRYATLHRMQGGIYEVG